MNDTEAFLRKIRENPDDDAPRLVFADYLDEQAVHSSGKTATQRTQWAALIRAQIAQERESVADTTFWNKWAGVDITKGVELPLTIISNDIFDHLNGPSRGFYDELTTDMLGLVQISEHVMKSMSPIRKLSLELYEEWEGIAKNPVLSLIRDLDVSDNSGISEKSFRGICNDPELRNLTDLNISCWEEFYEFNTLKILKGCDNFPHLRRLEISLDDYGDVHRLLNFPLCANLEYLSVRNNSIRFAELQSHSPIAKTLKSLGVHDYDDEGSINNSKWGEFHNIQRLSLYAGEKTNWVPSFLESQNWQHLTQIELRGQTLPSNVLSYFEEVEGTLSLNLDDLSFTQMKEILSSPTMSRVKALALNGECKESVIKILARNESISNLRSFEYNSNGGIKKPIPFFDTLCSSPIFANLLYLRIRDQLTLPILRQLNDSVFAQSLRGFSCEYPRFSQKWQNFLRKSNNFPNLVYCSFRAFDDDIDFFDNRFAQGRKKVVI